LYLGPFTTPRAAYWTLEAVRNIFPLRTCEGALKPDPQGRACFYHDIGRCGGPCVGAVSQSVYAALCDELLQLLRTGDAPPLQRLRARMEKFAAQWAFEEAARIKEQLDAIEIVAARLRRLERMRAQNNVVIVQPGPEVGSFRLFLVQGGVVRQQLVVEEWREAGSTLRRALRAVYDAPPPLAPFTGKEELDEMMILDRWLRAHGTEPCCVWQNERTRCWTATTARRVQAWAARSETA
jgi:excinuclease UvrABC nuclease subunit